MKTDWLSQMLRQLTAVIAVSVFVVGVSGSATLAKTELLVYTAIEAHELPIFKKAFEEDNPDIEIKWIRDSTGIVTAKLLAEKNNPKADVVWALAGTSLGLLANEGYFQPYAPKGVKELNPLYVDSSNDPPLWVGQRAYISAICYNTILAEQNNLPLPTSWKDLTKPVYKGHVAMPNPNSSGTGFLSVSGWLQIFGEDGGWKFMDGLHENIAWYTHSGSKPCKQAVSGEVAIGISFAQRAASSKTKGAPIEPVAPVEGVGWEIEAVGIVHNTTKLDAARRLADWSVTRKAHELYNKEYAVVGMPGVAKPVKNMPGDIEQRMIKNDFAWASANRMRILKKWASRYDSKSLPK